MDLSTLAGLGLGLLLVALAMLKGGSFSDFINLTSLAITLGGTVAATLVYYPASRLRTLFPVLRKAFRSGEEDIDGLIGTLLGYAEAARKEGALALEPEAESASDPFLRKGLNLIVDGTDPEDVRAVLETDLAALEERHRQGAGLFETMAQFAPAFGLIGTLIGLIQMLKALDDPSRIGPTMGAALLTTLYGVLLANLVLLPIAGKLKTRSAAEVFRKEIAIEGLLAVQAGDTPAMVALKLNGFLPPVQQASLNRRSGSGRGLDEEA